MMNFELFGAGCFGMVIGFVAWHTFRAGEGSFGVIQLTAFVGTLLGAVVLAAFPAGSTLFAAYASGLALGFFFLPLSGITAKFLAPHDFYHSDEAGDFPSQLRYIENNWPEVERVVTSALDQNGRVIREYHLLALPLDRSGRTAVLKKYARTYPLRARVKIEFLFGCSLRLLSSQAGSTEVRAAD